MYIFDMSMPLTLLLMLIATTLLIFLSQEVKKSYISAIPLFGYLILVVIHVIQIIIVPDGFKHQIPVLYRCIAIDLIFVFITFFGYLWVDDIESKTVGKKSIDNSLDWFWKKI